MTEHESHEEGFFANEQERIAEEAAWYDQQDASIAAGEVISVEGEFAIQPAGGEIVPVDHDHPDEPVNPLDIPDHYDLPMYGSIMMCPKCRHDRVRTTYHAHGILSEPCGTRFGWPDVQNLGEHLCRQCTNCSYGWPEAVAHGAA